MKEQLCNVVKTMISARTTDCLKDIGEIFC